MNGVRERLASRAFTAVAVVIAILWTTPTLGLLLSSFRPEEEIKTTGWWTVFGTPHLTLDNYGEVLSGGGNGSARLAEYLVNSVVITLPSVLFPLVLAFLAAYALAWIDFRGRDTLVVGIFALQIVPLQMALVPLLKLFSQGWLFLPAWDPTGPARFGQAWFAHTVFALPFAVFLLHNFLAGLPRDLIEAARVDGASHGTQFCRLELGRSNRRITMAAVAHRWGFSSPSHFSRTFRGAYGMSPSEWQALATSAFTTPAGAQDERRL